MEKIQSVIDLLSGKLVGMSHINIAINRLENIRLNINEIEKTACRTLEEIIEVGVKAVELEDQYEVPFDEIINHLKKNTVKEG